MSVLLSRIVLSTTALLLIFAGAACSSAKAQEAWPSIFDPFRIRTVHIEIDPQDWEAIKRDTNFYDPVLNIRKPCKLWVSGPTPPNDISNAITVQIRRKSDAALPSEGDPQKVSLKIDVNEYVEGQNLWGIKKMSLENGSGNGVLKEGFAMNMHRMASEAGFYSYEAGYASWVRLVVNGQYVGLYSSPEQRDVSMLKNRGMYRQGASWLYEINGGIFRDESVSTTDSPTHAHLNYLPFRSPNSPPANFETDVQAWVEMKGMLTFAAIEAFIANNDGLFTKSASNQGKNSFCMDFLPSTQHRRMYLPWDLDGGFNDTTWNIFTGGSGQQAQRRYQTLILQHTWFKEVYKHIFTDLLDGPLSSQSMNAWLDRVQPILQPALEEDPNADAGQFSSLRSYIASRVPNVRTQVGAIVLPPVFSPPAGEIAPGFVLRLDHGNTSGTSTIYYTLDSRDPRAAGGEIAAGALAYTGSITLNTSAHLTARVRNVNGSSVSWSNLREATFNIAGALDALRVTEIMYRPASDAAYEDADEFEFLEFKNTGATSLNLSGCYLEGIDFRFRPGTMLPAGGFLVLVANPAAFEARYPGVPYHGSYWKNLSNDGEKIRLLNSDGTTVLSVDYNNKPPWPLGPGMFGYSLVNLNPQGNPDEPANWRASTNLHGSPGAEDPAPAYGVGLVINEVLAKTNTPLEDAIEIHNPTSAPVDISGWYLSDSNGDSLLPDPLVALRKYRIPAGTVVPAGGYKVFYEAQFSPSSPSSDVLVPFALSQDGETVYLSSADAGGNLTGQIIGQKFGASENNIAWGRVETSAGFDFTALTQQTFGSVDPASKAEFRTGTGARNAAPKVGPVVINEIMYHPPAGGAEFIELLNISSDVIDLSGWTLEGAALVIPQGVTIAPGGFLLLVDTATMTVSQFREANGVPLSVPVVGALFDLGNGGESLELKKPNPDPLRSALRVDRVRYNDKTPWPTEAAGSGGSLERISPAAYGNEPLNWRCSRRGGTPGLPTGARSTLTISRGGDWKYHATGRDLGTAWRSEAYADNAWPRGVAVLGYGSPDVVTTIPFGADPGSKPPTVYFRKEFAVTEEISRITSLTLSARYSDGLVLYLNGSEVLRRSIPSGPVSFNTLGTPHDAGVYETIDLTAHLGKLVRGRNVLAVEMHLSSAADPDLLWDAELTGTLATSGVVLPPAISTHPQDRTAAAGATVSFSVSASGGEPLTYRWRFKGADIPASNSPTLTLTNVQVANEGLYDVVVFNTADSVTSTAARLVVDSDGDGMPDAWEDQFQFDKNDPADAAFDADGDGVNNLHEFLAGTLPRDPESVLRATISRTVDGGVAIHFTAQQGRGYTVQFKDALSDATWKKLLDVAPAEGVRELEIVDSAGAAAQRFYRVAMPTQP